MPQLVMSRREFAGIAVSQTTLSSTRREHGQPRRAVALGWISRTDGQVIVSEQLIKSGADGQ